MVDVIVIGAGLAGLMAARDLQRAKLQVMVLEARDRVGGRVHSRVLEEQGLPVEYGAEFIEGPSSLSWQLMREAGAALIEATGESWSVQSGRLQRGEHFRSGVDVALPRLPRNGADRSVGDALSAVLPGPTWQDTRDKVRRYVEGYDAASADRVSLRWFLEVEASEPGGVGSGQFHALNGNDALARHLAAELGAAVQLGQVVHRVDWSSGHVTVGATSATFTGRTVLVTLPIGVWQAKTGPGALRFEPELPDKREAAARLAMGAVVKVTVRFRDRFWEDVHSDDGGLYRLKFLQLNADFPTFWTRLPAHAPMLVAWAGGPRAERLSRCTHEEVRGQVLASLSEALGLSSQVIETQVLDVHFHDWQSDPFARGAYSYVPPGELSARDQLAAPVQNTLFFAGEATAHRGHTATMEGALLSGQRAAREIIAALHV